MEEPEDGYIPAPEHEEGGNSNKRSASTDQKENASPKKRRTKTTDIALENPPTDEVGTVQKAWNNSLVLFESNI